jgi:hypothetical protein
MSGTPTSYWKTQPYIASQVTTLDVTGGWLDTFGVRVATFEATFDTTSINLAGSLIIEYTGLDTAPTYVTLVLLPTGCFHTGLTGWAIDTGGIGLKLTAGAAQQGCVTISVTNPPVGKLRLRWDATAGGGAGANTLVVTARSWGP